MKTAQKRRRLARERQARKHDAPHERRIKAAIAAIEGHGFTIRWVDWCEDSETPGIIGMYAGVTIRHRREVKIATRRRTREEIADVLEHELHHVEDPSWDCGNRDVFGRGGPQSQIDDSWKESA